MANWHRQSSLCRPQQCGSTPKATPNILAGIWVGQIIRSIMFIVSHWHLFYALQWYNRIRYKSLTWQVSLNNTERNTQRVIGCMQKHAASRGFLATARGSCCHLIKFAVGLRNVKQIPVLADRTFSLMRQACVCLLSVTLCIVAKRWILEQKLLLTVTAYRKSYIRNRLVSKWITLTFV